MKNKLLIALLSTTLICCEENSSTENEFHLPIEQFTVYPAGMSEIEKLFKAVERNYIPEINRLTTELNLTESDQLYKDIHLLLAVRVSNLEQVKKWLTSDANPNAPLSTWLQTSLFEAVANSKNSEKDFVIIQLLMDKNAQISARDHYGWSALDTAIADCNTKAVELLLADNKNNLETTINKGRTAQRSLSHFSSSNCKETADGKSIAALLKARSDKI